MDNNLEWLQKWYSYNCDGEWEHAEGVEISTLDNPGWKFSASLKGTTLEDKDYPVMSIDNGNDDWLVLQKKDCEFVGCGDAGKLNQIIQFFKEWVLLNGQGKKGRGGKNSRASLSWQGPPRC